MTLPHLNGKTGMALSVSSLLGVLGVGAALVKDRLTIEHQLSTLTTESRERGESNRDRIRELERRLEESERRLQLIERRLQP